MAYELYQTLEVSPEASALEIKRAYFQLVRKYSPEKDPERFKQIREAYNTLFDPKARQNYDSLQQYGDQIIDLIDQAEEKMNAEEYQSAISLLKRVLVLAPAANAARNLLGLCYIHIENWDFAVKVYRTLTKTNPDVPVYWSNLGHVYKQQAESLDNEDAGTKYQNARECFGQAIKLEPFNSEPYLEMARTFLNERNYAEAFAWAERAINADGKVDIYDFDAMFFICSIHLFSGESYKIEITAQRIASLLPDTKDVRKYAADRFANLGYEVAKVGTKLADVYFLRAAIQFFNIAMGFDQSDLEIRKFYDKVQEIVAPLEQYEVLKQDSLILPGCQRLAAFCLADFFSLHGSDSERKSLLDNIIAEILADSSRKVLSSVKRIKSQYLAIYELNKNLFNEIEKAA